MKMPVKFHPQVENNPHPYLSAYFPGVPDIEVGKRAHARKYKWYVWIDFLAVSHTHNKTTLMANARIFQIVQRYPYKTSIGQNSLMSPRTFWDFSFTEERHALEVARASADNYSPDWVQNIHAA